MPLPARAPAPPPGAEDPHLEAFRAAEEARVLDHFASEDGTPVFAALGAVLACAVWIAAMVVSRPGLSLGLGGGLALIFGLGGLARRRHRARLRRAVETLDAG